MSDSAPTAEGDSNVAEADTKATTGMPRWVKISLIAVIGLVALFVALHFAGVPMGHGPSRHMGGRHEEASRVAEGARRISVTADGFRFDPDEISVTAGEDIAIALTSRDVVHDFVIDELDAHVSAKAGEAATGGFRADRAGRYTFYCSEPGHLAEGMEGTLTVTDDGTSGEGEHRPPAGGVH